MADREAYTAAKSEFLQAVLERTAKHGKTTGNGTP